MANYSPLVRLDMAARHGQLKFGSTLAELARSSRLLAGEQDPLPGVRQQQEPLASGNRRATHNGNKDHAGLIGCVVGGGGGVAFVSCC